MLRAPTSQTISDIALLQREKAQLSQQMNQASKLSLPVACAIYAFLLGIAGSSHSYETPEY